MELTIKIQIGCEEALTKALTALAVGATHAPQIAGRAELPAGGADGTSGAPAAACAPRKEGNAKVATGDAPEKIETQGLDAAAEVRKVMSATRARLNAKAGSALYANLNAEFVPTARQLGAEKPTALPADKVGEFKKICETIMLDADGESLAPPF